MATARDLYQQVLSQGYLTLVVGEKPQFQAPFWYFPCGGGVYGFDTGGAGTFNNGWPGQDSILKLARPVVFPVRQNFSVVLEFFPVGTTNVLDQLNDVDECQRSLMVVLDGLLTRDVQ